MEECRATNKTETKGTKRYIMRTLQSNTTKTAGGITGSNRRRQQDKTGIQKQITNRKQVWYKARKRR